MSALLMNKMTPSATEKINKKFAPSDSEKETNNARLYITHGDSAE